MFIQNSGNDSITTKVLYIDITETQIWYMSSILNQLNTSIVPKDQAHSSIFVQAFSSRLQNSSRKQGHLQGGKLSVKLLNSYNLSM